MNGIGMVLINHDCAYISLCLMKNHARFSDTDVKNLLSYIIADQTYAVSKNVFLKTSLMLTKTAFI